MSSTAVRPWADAIWASWILAVTSPDGPDGGHAGPKRLVGDDAAPFHLHRETLGKETVGVGAAANGHQYAVGGDHLFLALLGEVARRCLRGSPPAAPPWRRCGWRSPFFQDHGRFWEISRSMGAGCVHGLRQWSPLHPKLWYTEANSTPMTPPPMMSQVLVQLILKKRNSSLVPTWGRSGRGWGPGGLEPVATKIFSPVSSTRAPPQWPYGDALGRRSGVPVPWVQVDLIGFDQAVQCRAKLFNPPGFAVVDFLDVKDTPWGFKAHRFKFLDTPIQGGSVEQGFGGDAPRLRQVPPTWQFH